PGREAMRMIDSGIIDRLKAITGPKGWIDDARTLEPHVTEWRGLYKGKTPLLLRPAGVEEVSRILAFCNEARVAIVPQAGNTSLCGASVPDGTGRQIILSLARMNRVRAIDAFNATMVAEAGCVLADIHAAALAENRMFPLSFAAEGSAQL